VLGNYDDKNHRYLRIVVTSRQLRIEYHPASDGPATKTPDDFVKVDLKRPSWCISTPVTSGDRQRLGGLLINERVRLKRKQSS
jgi:hypothetical protein